ncbi:MAG TPA: hypothetical protein DD381_07420 [Lentisphaeria bacterium]|nr:hypothetical protein [Lentisphaeria bacterium]
MFIFTVRINDCIYLFGIETNSFRAKAYKISGQLSYLFVDYLSPSISFHFYFIHKEKDNLFNCLNLPAKTGAIVILLKICSIV